MRRAAVVFVSLAAAAVAHAQASAPPAAWFGTWTLNVARSTYVPGPPPYRRASYRIEPWQDGVKVTYDMVHPRGGVTHLEWTGRLDGRDYPLQGIEENMTYAYAPAADGAWTVTVKVDGRIVARSTVTVSPDGRSMTTSTSGVNAAGRRVTTVTVYEKTK